MPSLQGRFCGRRKLGPILVRDASHDTIIHLLESEARVVEELERKNFRWAAKLRGCNFTFNYAVGYPFIALTWIRASQLLWSDNSLARPLRDKVLSQIVLIHASLIESTKEPSMLNAKLTPAELSHYLGITAGDHFMRIIQNKIRSVRNGLLPEIIEQDCLDQMNTLPSVLLPELNDAPFALDHADLSPQNILIDAQYNVTG